MAIVTPVRKVGPTYVNYVSIYTPFRGTGLGSGLVPTLGAYLFPNATVGVFYSIKLDLASPDRPITFSGSSLPSWMTMTPTGDGHSFTLSGTPTIAGTSSFSLTASNAYGSSTQGYSITVSPNTTGVGTAIYLRK